MKLTDRFYHKKSKAGMVLYVEVEKAKKHYPHGPGFIEEEYVEADEQMATELAVMLLKIGGEK